MNNININTIIELKLGLEEYFVLFCVYNNQEELLKNYTNNCKKIDNEIFNSLKSKELLTINSNIDNKIYFENLFITDKGIELVNKYNHFNDTNNKNDFEDFLKYYPKEVIGINGHKRKLHLNKSKCKKLYHSSLLEVTHEQLCKCAQAYFKEKERTNSLPFTHLLATWLHQKNYEAYLEDIDNLNMNDNNYNLDVV